MKSRLQRGICEEAPGSWRAWPRGPSPACLPPCAPRRGVPSPPRGGAPGPPSGPCPRSPSCSGSGTA
eukprot:3329341-Rhodomonas_salina.1